MFSIFQIKWFKVDVFSTARIRPFKEHKIIFCLECCFGFFYVEMISIPLTELIIKRAFYRCLQVGNLSKRRIWLLEIRIRKPVKIDQNGASADRGALLWCFWSRLALLSLCLSGRFPPVAPVREQQLEPPLRRDGELLDALLPPLRSGGCWMYHAVSAALGGSGPPPPPLHCLLPALRDRPTR